MTRREPASHRTGAQPMIAQYGGYHAVFPVAGCYPFEQIHREIEIASKAPAYYRIQGHHFQREARWFRSADNIHA